MDKGGSAPKCECRPADFFCDNVCPGVFGIVLPKRLDVAVLVTVLLLDGIDGLTLDP